MVAIVRETRTSIGGAMSDEQTIYTGCKRFGSYEARDVRLGQLEAENGADIHASADASIFSIAFFMPFACHVRREKSQRESWEYGVPG